jgi:hypothetical protein
VNGSTLGTGFARSPVCAAIATVVLVTGCGSSPSTTSTAYRPADSTPSAVSAAATTRSSARATSTRAPATRLPTRVTTRTPVAAPALPAGQVPQEVVGRWSGGPGDRTGEYLLITADGQYARGRNAAGGPYRRGVIVARGTRFVTYDVDGQQEAGTWEYTNAAGIEVLGVYFGSDYYSYAKA